MAITNAQQYKQILQKEREEKAFGGVMGLDGRLAYVGGSYGASSGGGYQGNSGAPGSSSSSSNQGPAGGASAGGNYGGNVNAQQTYAGKTYANQNYATQRSINAANQRAAQRAAAAKARAAQIAAEKAKKDREEKKAKDLSQKGFDSTNIFGNIKKKIADYNKNYKTKQLARYQKAKIDELNFKLGKLGVDFYGDTEETYGDIIQGKDYGDYTSKGVQSITDFGPEGTGKYSQQFIDDVLSGKRKPPESFQEIGFSGIPGAVANIIGPKISGPITKEELMDIYSGGINSYIGARDFDIDKSTGKEMMEIFEPNRFKREFGDTPGSGDGGNNNIIPISSTTTSSLTPVEETVDNRSELEKLLDARGAAYRFFADGGRVPAMAGGIMNPDVIGGAADGNIDEMGRQMYFVGKLVKKATRAVKKIAKSPIGKAALLYGGGTFLGGLKAFGGAGLGSGTFLSNLKSGQGLANLGGFLKGKLFSSATTLPGTKSGGLLNFLKTPKGAMSAIGIASALPFLFQGEEEEEAPQYEGPSIDIPRIRRDPYRAMGETYRFYAEGGKAEPVAKKTMPLIDMDGKEMDLRDEGGFVPLGRMERADDVPARLSKNEFVFTADAVRNAGEGDIDKGAEVMYNMMKNLESGGEVSEESQGLDGAREMFKTSQRLEEVL